MGRIRTCVGAAVGVTFVYEAMTPFSLPSSSRGACGDSTCSRGIRHGPSCHPDFATCAAVDGTGIRVDLSLDEIEEIQGYVAAEANHTKNATLRKELDRLFGKLQLFLDTYDDQSD